MNNRRTGGLPLRMPYPLGIALAGVIQLAGCASVGPGTALPKATNIDLQLPEGASDSLGLRHAWVDASGATGVSPVSAREHGQDARGTHAIYQQATRPAAQNEIERASFSTASVADDKAAGTIPPTHTPEKPPTERPAVPAHSAEIDLGMLLAASQENSASKPEFAKPAQVDPIDPQVAVRTAIAALQRGEVDRAIGILEAHRADCADYAAWHRTLGAAYYRRGDLESAREALDRALSLDKTSAASYFLKGCTLARLGQLDAAEQDYQQAGSLDPKYIAASRPNGGRKTTD